MFVVTKQDFFSSIDELRAESSCWALLKSNWTNDVTVRDEELKFSGGRTLFRDSQIELQFTSLLKWQTHHSPNLPNFCYEFSFHAQLYNRDGENTTLLSMTSAWYHHKSSTESSAICLGSQNSNSKSIAWVSSNLFSTGEGVGNHSKVITEARWIWMDRPKLAVIL